jgi:hypothetical protein
MAYTSKKTLFSPKSIEDNRQVWLQKILSVSSPFFKIEQIDKSKPPGTNKPDPLSTFLWSFSDLLKFNSGKLLSKPQHYKLKTSELDDRLVVYYPKDERQDSGE